MDTALDGSERLVKRPLTPEGATSGAKDCTELWRQGYSRSGVYTIHPYFRSHFEVFCDMDSGGGGWTVLQLRNNGKVNFERSWEDYVSGLGSPYSEQCLGLEKLHIMTRHQTQPSYWIHLPWYDSGSTESDLMHACNEMRFSTPDRDNDNLHNANCAHHQQSGWWFTSAHLRHI